MDGGKCHAYLLIWISFLGRLPSCVLRRRACRHSTCCSIRWPKGAEKRPLGVVFLWAWLFFGFGWGRVPLRHIVFRPGLRQ